MVDTRYDLVVIGSGPAGEKGAAQAAYFGKRVALVEREDALGGAACNTGTLPSKTLRETALTLSAFRSRDLYGLDLSLRREVTVQDLLLRESTVKATERMEIAGNITRHGIDLFRGVGSFAGPHQVAIDPGPHKQTVLEADKVLIATGSRPRRPSVFPFGDARIWDSDQILNLEQVPRRMIVVGGGVIGCEYACVFAALGVQVFLVHDRKEILPFLDRDICTVLQGRMGALGVTFLLGEKVLGCEPGTKDVRLELAGKSLVADSVLVAAGRTGNVADLKLEAAGIKPMATGFIGVNENFQTEVPHIYAAGDVVGFPALASTSMEQARMAMVHAFDLKYKKSVARVLPLAIYTIPEVATAGETEMSLLETGQEYVAGRAYYDRNARGKIIGDREGMLKLLFRTSDMKLLGVSVVGEMASEIVHVGLIALMLDADNDLFIETCFNYPTLGQLYKYATYDAMQHRNNGSAAVQTTK
jgi:NAD(P) transhydrogenase